MSNTSSLPPRRVALLVEASRAYARGLVRGVARYNREHERWSVYFAPRGLSDPLPAWLENWRGDGILARIENRRMAEAVMRTGLPAIDLRRAVGGLGMPTMGPDDALVARLAFDHLRERGFRHFGYFGPRPSAHPALDARSEHFHRLTRQAGSACGTFQFRRPSNRSWEEEFGRIVTWLGELPKPLGVLAGNDDYGLQLLDACHRSGFLVPDEVAVVGVGNDDCLCNLSLPPLTSIDLNPQRIGYEAARLLDQMMAGQAPPALHMVVEPSGIQTRRSTDVLATTDGAVIRAVKFIRERVGRRIQVADVLQHVRMSRAALEPRVKRVLGRTIYEEIQRIQIERVKELLLLNTGAPLKQVAAQAGFRYPEYMMRVFRQATGQTPAEYRKTMR